MTDLTQVKQDQQNNSRQVATLIHKTDTMSSIEIAEITGKRHDAILRDIRNLLTQGVNAHNFVLVEYTDKKGEKRPCFNLTKKGCLILASGYNALLREKIINRLEELEMEKRNAAVSAPAFAPQPEGIVFWHDGTRVVSSRTLAMMCGRNHSDMARSIRNAYRLLDRPRRSFIEICEKDKCKEILVTVKGFAAVHRVCTSMPEEVTQTVSAAFNKARRGIIIKEQTPVSPHIPIPSMPSDPSELLARFTKAMAVMLGVNPDNLSGLIQKGGEL